MSALSLCASVGVIASPWRSACDGFDALPRSADLAILAVLLLAVSVTERLRHRRSR